MADGAAAPPGIPDQEEAGHVSDVPAAAADLDPGATSHALRHGYVSRALKAGVPAKAVADHRGTSPAMIARHYGKCLAEDRKRYAAVAAPPLRLDGGDATRPARLTAVGRS